MGVDVSSLAFRPPPPTYALVACDDDAATLRFADGWTPQRGLAQPRCPIRLAAPCLPPGAAAGLRHVVLLLRTGAPALHVTHSGGGPARLTLLYAHGTSFDLGVLRDHVAALAAHLGVNVLAYDYRGYGAAKDLCSPSERACCEDGEAALAALLAAGVPLNTVVMYGLSLGAAPTMHLAAGAGAGGAGVVLRSGFLSAWAVALGRPGAALPGSPFDNAAAARRITAPVLLVHGRRDELVGSWQAERLAALCRAAVTPLYLKDCGHFDVERSPRFMPRLAHFLTHETRRYTAEDS